MKLFKCDRCGQPVYFENYFCVKCNASLGFDSTTLTMLSLEAGTDNTYTLFDNKGKLTSPPVLYKYCINKQYNVCNWVLPYDDESQYCFACDLNRTIPDLGQPDHWQKWSRIEMAKHRLVYSLLRLKLPVVSKFRDDASGLAFDFKAENKGGTERLLTGHDNGLITLNIDEADDAIRVMARRQMDEVYRTVLGHFRHEIGHYYWEQLIKDSDKIDQFRHLFGDERIDYEEALKRHYGQGPQANWTEKFISAYASAHPWEDWAETWAHYIHIIDTLETAYSYGMKTNPVAASPKYKMKARFNIDPYTSNSFKDIIERWVPLTYVMNSLNRSMGLKDSYPFVINAAVKEKLNFIHETIKGYLQSTG